MSATTLAWHTLGDVGMSAPLERLRQAYFLAVPAICSERPKLVTRFSAELGLFERDRVASLDKARVYRKVLEQRAAIVSHTRAHRKTEDGFEEFSFEDTSPFAGSTTSHFKGVPLYPELLGLALWPELRTMARRKSNPYYITGEDIRVLNEEVFPRWMDRNITELARLHGGAEDRARVQLVQRIVLFLTSKPNCISHTIPDFSRAVREGLRAVIDDALGRRAGARDAAQRDFYQAVAEALEGIVAYARRLADAAASAAAVETGPRRGRLEEIARIYRRVPEFPAQTFREGLTTIWLCWIAIHLENPNVGLSLGRLDQVLYELYRADIEARRLTVEQAVELLGYLWLKIGDHVPAVPEAGEQLFGGTGSNQAITIGGVDAAGRDAVNDLTYVMLHATALMKLRDPNLNARFHPAVNDEGYLRRLCEVNIATGATPALHNDAAVIRSLTAGGHTLEQARDYGVIGCVEPGSNGRFYGHSGAILLNLPSVLELALFNGRHRNFGAGEMAGLETGPPAAFTSFDQFRSAFETQLRWMLDQAIGANELFGRTHQRFYPTPILSALFEGPMEKGADLIDGGAAINASGIAVIGLADVTDSLAAIETLVYRERAIGFPEFIAALEADYQGHDALLARLRNPDKTPRFGNDDARAGRHAAWLVEVLYDAVRGRKNYRGGTYRVGYWTMTNHAGFGRFLGAMPNGRRKGESFASGITPCSGVTPSLTPALHSVAALPPERITNGVALNLKFTPEDGDRERMLDHFAAFTRGYFDAGGMEIQFNVTSHAKFLEALKEPDPELLVRVSGYTAYFKDLNPQMQKEIVDRTEYRLSTGAAVPYAPLPLRKGGGNGRR